jgi:benzoyl-CoA reductase/2-hydroxyglutaryl-CoA dehydratase subunit BcrC/BadD/HgdB
MVMDDFRKLQATSRALYRESFQKEKQNPLTSLQTHRQQHFSPSDSPKLLQAQTFASKDEVVNQLLEERKERIKEVVTEVQDLHEAVRVTGTLIHDTAPALDVIEANINAIEHDTEEGFHAVASVCCMFSNEN